MDATSIFPGSIPDRIGMPRWGLNLPSAFPPPATRKQPLSPRKSSRSRQPKPVAIPDWFQELFDDALRYHRAGALDRAIVQYERILFLDPDHADAHNNLGVALSATGKLAAAISHYERALALKPGNAASHFNLATALERLGKMPEAVLRYRRALVLKPDYAEAHNNLGNLLALQGLADEAMSHYRRALETNPGHVNAHNNVGNILRDQGRFEAAMAHYDRAIAIRPTHAEAHFHRAEIKTFRPGDADLAVLESLADREDTRSSPYIHFALGKALEDTGDYARSFEHLRMGNRLRRSQIAYDEKAEARVFRRVAEVFDASLLERLRGMGDPSAAPVFIVGMPRSGSTLAEQILASHPLIHGAGEREDLIQVAGAAFPEAVAALDRDGLLRMAQDYLTRMPLPEGKVRTIDKLPGNFLRIGLIRLLFPNARIIHTRRNPLDTCISCYSKLFAVGQHFSYDLAELGRYYRRYAELMRHWDSVLPSDAMLHVSYEAVVDDLEGQARRMVEFCGLEWDERCLRFYESRRPVKTASSVQVRKPLFRTSVERWKHFEAGLAPLIAELGGLLPEQAMAAHR